MSTIVSTAQNGGNILRWNNHILRTPFLMKILPDQKKVYQIGDRRTVGSDGYLHGGFRRGGTSRSDVINVGYQLINYMINGEPLWLDASGPHDPEFVWYQGAYCTSNDYISSGKNQSEAYAQLAGFHFTLPSSIIGQVRFVSVCFENMGSVWAYGPAVDRNYYNKNINQADYGWGDGFNVPFFVLNTPTCNYHQLYINANFPCDNVDISPYGTQGQFQGVRNLWDHSNAANTDGRIPTLTNPVIQSYDLGTETFSMFVNNGGGWIVPSIIPEMWSSSDYIPNCGWPPSGVQINDNYWACASLRDIYIYVGLGD